MPNADHGAILKIFLHDPVDNLFRACVDAACRLVN